MTEQHTNFQVESTKPIDYNTLLVYHITETAKSFAGDVHAADKLVLALRGLLYPFTDPRFKREEEELMPKLNEARKNYILKWGTDQQKNAWAYFDLVNQEFGLLIECAERVHLLGGRRASKMGIIH